MKGMMHYKGYYGSIDFEPEDLIFYGKVEFIHALVSFEGETAKEIDDAFKEAVDDYLNSCVARGIEPEMPFKGSLNVRIGRERHEKAALLVREIGCKSLNALINQALDHEFERFSKIA